MLGGHNDLLGGFEELECIVPQGRQRNHGFSREKIRGVSMPPGTPTKYPLPLPNPVISPVTAQQ
jgi:hypothetical protein